MASRGALDALLGRLLQDGTELELRGGLNFIGITLTANEAEDVYDVEIGAFAGGLVAEYFAGTGTVAGAGTFRFGNNVGGAVGRKTTGESVLMGYIDGSNNMLVGPTTGPYEAVSNLAWYVLGSGGSTYYWRVEGVGDIMAVSPSGLTVAAINGAAPVAPVEGTVLADANANIVATDGSQIRIPVLTANRTYDINNTSAIDEETITLYRTGTEAFTATIRDHADATIATFPASTKLAGVFRKATGANFVFVGWQRIA